TDRYGNRGRHSSLKGRKIAVKYRDGSANAIASVLPGPPNVRFAGCVCRKPRPFDLVKELRTVGHDGRVALLPFEAVGFARCRTDCAGNGPGDRAGEWDPSNRS